MSENEHVVILGAGPAGLATGHELSVSGVKVSVVDRNDFVGGLCNTMCTKAINLIWEATGGFPRTKI